MPSPPLLQRLRERKLVQWALAYLAGAFVVFQLLDALAEPLSLTPTIQRSVLVVVGIGFFITLILAWYHGEKGRQRVSGPELLMVAALLVVAGVALSLLSDDERVPEPSQVTAEARAGDGRPGIAVLPCANMSIDPEDEFLAPGLHDAILLRLQKISGLFSIGRTSVQQYAVDPAGTDVIASALGVGFVGECSVQKHGDQIRLIFQLLDGVTGGQLWAEQYDRDLTAVNLFDIQSDLSQQVASQIGAVLTPDEQIRIGDVPTENLEAYEAYLLGRYHLGRRDDLVGAMSEAVRYFQLAIQQDPDLAVAHAGLAGAYGVKGTAGFNDPRESRPLAERWAGSALALDSTIAEARLWMALLRQEVSDWGEVEKEIRRAIQLSPNDPMAHKLLADLLLVQGRIEEGLREGRAEVALDPLSSSTLAAQARRSLHSRRYDEAVELGEALRTRDPGNITAGWHLALSLILGGQSDQVRGLLSGAASAPSSMGPMESAGAALIFGLMGMADSARVYLDEALSRSGDEYLDPGVVWPTYAALGEFDEAFAWLEQGLEVGAYSNAFVGVNPLADPLRDDPRFQAILDRIGLGHLKKRFDSLAAADPRGGT
jgi:serine/threonine-protein kinase